jgi:hypothetical protein
MNRETGRGYCYGTDEFPDGGQELRLYWGLASFEGAKAERACEKGKA